MAEGQTYQSVGMTQVLAEEFEQIHGEKVCTGEPTLQDVYKAIHALPEEDRRTALCLSGGGIRSASFALGVLQALAEKQILSRFHYLSTVSGGGYIGAWLSMWRKEVKDDDQLMRMLSRRREAEKDRLQAVEAALKAKPEHSYKDEDAYKEPVEVTGLRENSNFLTPKLGAMSADTWTLVALYIRNLLLNWLVFVPLIAAILLIPLLSRDVLFHATTLPETCRHYYIPILAIALYILAVFISVRGRFAANKDRAVDQNTFLQLELVPIYVASTLISIYAVGPHTIDGSLADLLASIERRTGLKASFLDEWVLTLPVAGAVIYGTGWALGYALHGKRDEFWGPISRANPLPPVLLLVLWTAAGVLAGILVQWGVNIASTKLGDNPSVVVAFGVGWISTSIFLANAAYLAVTSASARGDVEREWLARSSGWFVAMTVVWGLFAVIVLKAPAIVDAVYGLVGLALGGGVGAVVARIGSSAKTLTSFAGKPRESVSMTFLLSIGALIFLFALVVGFSSVLPGIVTYFAEMAGWPDEPMWQKFMAIVICLAFGLAMSNVVNVNRFSAHSLYRNRLIRAFLGSARGPWGIHGRSRDPFTGFDDKDNVRVHELAMPRDKGKTRLFPVINMALNTVAGANTAWQERKAESFTVTPLHAGNEWVKYWPSANYCSQQGISLGTAMAISGAAASPNMGYHSSPLIGFIMTLFNVRLGWWLGNPSRPSTAPQESPPFGMLQFVQELFGLTSDKSPFVYLTDGGHFENLGIYEMVRRRCHFILVSDAGCDPNCAFADLGNAVRKIWIDLGVKINFSKIMIEGRGEPDKQGQGVYCAVATIKYPEGGPAGHLVYLKPCFLGTEPADIRAYAAANKAFPHESTSDQFFSESQMESYRALGAHIVETILGNRTTEHPDPPMIALRFYWRNVLRYH